MLYAKQDTTSKIVIDNNHTTATTYSFEIVNDLSERSVNFIHSATTVNDRYIEFNLDVVEKVSDQELPYKIALERGMNSIVINSDYTDILFVDFDEQDVLKYDKQEHSATTKTTYVYKKKR
jgi:hypothetical protein